MLSAQAHLYTLVEEVDPVENIDTLGGADEKELSFPFRLSTKPWTPGTLDDKTNKTA